MVKDIKQQNAERRLRNAKWEKRKCGLKGCAISASIIGLIGVASLIYIIN